MISKSGQTDAPRPPCSTHADFHRAGAAATAYRIDFRRQDGEVPRHKHRQGQLILALRGAVTCTTDTSLWIVPPGHGIWIPGGVPHGNQATANARLAYLFVEPGEASLPDRCCALSVSPMLREMILRLADLPERHAEDDHVRRLIRVVLDELALMPSGEMELPISDHPKIVQIAAALTADPGDRRTLREWATRVAMSERSLKRLIVAETGLSFRDWRRRLHLIVALRELASGATVQRVAGDRGYESVTAFIVMFKKALGTTPARYFAEPGDHSRAATGRGIGTSGVARTPLIRAPSS